MDQYVLSTVLFGDYLLTNMNGHYPFYSHVKDKYNDDESIHDEENIR